MNEEHSINPLGIVTIVFGLLAVMAGVLDWNWFMNSPRAWALVALFGRFGARIFYILLGIGIVVLGMLMLTGVVSPPPARR
ncbi:hypothetical protein Pan216_16300 [Planctomycetes bacterium Pan216]|uniref:Immunity protein 17 n=1 Tax=Kolteria novifilia TaxID=2527975 RepID=A0A518B1C3_9BACT|nr:hypothetical protein Pan216_16300 [Planctomycetes bacterium Pan216]